MRRIAIAVTAALLLGGCGFGATSDPHLPVGAGTPSVSVTTGIMQTVPAAAPTHLAVPSIGLSTEVTEMATEQCPVLDPPSSDRAYWVECRAEPGTDSDGTVFVIGHSIAKGQAIFNDLSQVAPGDKVTLDTPKGTLTYQVTETATYEKSEARTEAQLRERVPGRLVLVTCYLGEDGRTLTTENFVAYATLVEAIARG